MTNVAAVKRVIEHVLERPGFTGEVIVFENTHFRLADGSGLSRAWMRPSERNVDVPGWNKLGDLIPHFRERSAPVSFVGLVDAGDERPLRRHVARPRAHARASTAVTGAARSSLATSATATTGTSRRAFRLEKSWVDEAKTPLTWPRFTSPRTGLVVDLKDGVKRREGEAARVRRPEARVDQHDHRQRARLDGLHRRVQVDDGSRRHERRARSARIRSSAATRRSTTSVVAARAPRGEWPGRSPSSRARSVRPTSSSPSPSGLPSSRAVLPPDEDIRHSAATCTRKRTVIAGTRPGGDRLVGRAQPDGRRPEREPAGPSRPRRPGREGHQVPPLLPGGLRGAGPSTPPSSRSLQGEEARRRRSPASRFCSSARAAGTSAMVRAANRITVPEQRSAKRE